MRVALMGVGLAGAAGAAGASLGGAAGSSARVANATARTVTSVARIGSGVVQATQGVTSGVVAGYTHAASQERVTSRREGNEIQRLSRDSGDFVEQLRTVLTQTQRMNDRSFEMLNQRNAGRVAINRNMLRG